MDDLTERLARFATGFRADSLSPAMVDTIVDHIVDAMGCAVAGADETACVIARSLAAEAPVAGAGASVIGLPHRTTPELAAFCNGSMTRCLDFNDTFNGNKTGGHPSDMMPAILAAAEQAGLPGRAVVDGVFVAYEVFGALADEVALRDYAVDQGAFLSIGVACAIASICKLDLHKTTNAISLALTTTMPLRASRSGELSAWKGCATAHSAANAVSVTRLAARGMEGPPQPFRGVDGFLQRLPIEMALDHVGRPFDGKYVIERTSFKFQPVENGAQAPVELFRKLRARFGPDDIRSIEAWGYEFLVKEIGGGRSDAREKWDPQTRETADHSLPYLLAVTLMDGEVTLDSFALDRVRDPKLRPLMQKIKVSLDPAAKGLPSSRQPVRFVITLNDGTIIEESCEYPFGHPTNPGDRAAVEEKFKKLAAPKLGAGGAADLLSCVQSLAFQKDLGGLTEILRAVPVRTL